MNNTDGNRLIKFSETFGRMVAGPQSGKPLVLRDWQKKLLFDLAEAQPRRGLIMLPRKNGKSYLSSLIALYALCGDGEEGAEVLGCAGARDQAKLVFNIAKRIVELGPLQNNLKIYRNEIVQIGRASCRERV